MTRVAQPARGSIDEHAFDRLVEPHRAALLVHCYRMLGSLQDAEDALQDALLRAWSAYARFDGRASLRTWLHRIATNACLDEIARRPRRPVAVEPFPDALLERIADPLADPAALHAANEGLELAFLAALQVLPGRQRAVLVLRDVLGWRSAEVAVLLDVTPTAVNSALQRARETIAARPPVPATLPVRARRSREIVRRCVEAWNRADIDALVAVLQDDAALRMPPQPAVAGARAIGRFLDRLPDGGSFREMQVVASVGNGRPALVVRRVEHGELRPHGVLVLEIGEGGLTAIDASISRRLAARFLDTLDEGPDVAGTGTPDDPWQLRTPPGSSQYTIHRDEANETLVCVVGKTTLGYRLRAIEDLHAMLAAHGDWMPLGAADEQKPAAEGTVEAWARAADNPVGGWYGTKKGLRGRFALYVPPLLEELGLVELEHNARNNRVRARIRAR